MSASSAIASPERVGARTGRAELEALLARSPYAHALGWTASASVPSGFSALDALLPGGGWPLGRLTELLVDGRGAGALALTLPALARLSGQGRWIAWVSPPYLPYAPALAAAGVELARVLVIRAPPAESLWAAEQALAAGAVAFVWPGAGAASQALRRLVLAAERGGAWGVVVRPLRVAGEPSPASLRLVLAPSAGRVAVRIVKCRGRAPGGTLELDLDPGRRPEPPPKLHDELHDVARNPSSPPAARSAGTGR